MTQEAWPVQEKNDSTTACESQTKEQEIPQGQTQEKLPAEPVTEHTSPEMGIPHLEGNRESGLTINESGMEEGEDENESESNDEQDMPSTPRQLRASNYADRTETRQYSATTHVCEVRDGRD